jgi:hypothetical protein
LIKDTKVLRGEEELNSRETDIQELPVVVVCHSLLLPFVSIFLQLHGVSFPRVPLALEPYKEKNKKIKAVK